MATRSHIGKQNADGSIKYIYCHWDGYPEHVGKILGEHYTDETKLDQLIAGGDISSLEPSIECPEGHNFENPIEGYTVFYARDRGEELQNHTALTQSEFKDDYIDYHYLWCDGVWKIV